MLKDFEIQTWYEGLRLGYIFLLWKSCSLHFQDGSNAILECKRKEMLDDEMETEYDGEGRNGTKSEVKGRKC